LCGGRRVGQQIGVDSLKLGVKDRPAIHRIVVDADESLLMRISVLVSGPLNPTSAPSPAAAIRDAAERGIVP
jgi:hypothetical protein